jgi:hypothetical protein
LGYNTSTWKCHNETLCIDVLNKNVFLSKTEVKQVLSGRWRQWEGGGHNEKVWEGEYGRNIT